MKHSQIEKMSNGEDMLRIGRKKAALAVPGLIDFLRAQRLSPPEQKLFSVGCRLYRLRNYSAAYTTLKRASNAHMAAHWRNVLDSADF
ncbi:hypothetical protein [Rhizobium sp. Kim5]|uniref:hypothetical protein n=1 Tax=Rhizobium sp. Kim5 TaxID=2020311 RepID=UPI000F7468E7|nr:hypothetical protein [Rhizobium sp. Kim5]